MSKLGIYHIDDDHLDYKKVYFDLFAKVKSSEHSIKIESLAIYETEHELEYFILNDNDSIVRSFINILKSADTRNKIKAKNKISVFCHYDCSQLLNLFVDYNEFSVHLTYFRKERFEPNKDTPDSSDLDIDIKEGYCPDLLESIRWKLERDFFTPFESVYGKGNMTNMKKDFYELAAKSKNLFAYNNGEIVGYLFSLPYHDSKLMISYTLIGFIWLDQCALTKAYRKKLSSQLFARLSSEKPPFCAAVHTINMKSRRFFENNGFIPCWIRMSRK
jgi:hypothetical protein